MKESEAMTKIHSHERECAIRYENIDKRLEDGSKRFARIEYLIWGLYGLLITTLGVDKFLWEKINQK